MVTVKPPPPSRVAALHWVRHTLAAGALRDLLGLPGLENARVVVVKGMATSTLLYAHPSERPLSDVDLRTTPRDLARVVLVARRRGIPVDWSSAQLGAVAVRIGGVDVELESTVGPPGVCAVTVGEIVARAAPRELSPGLVALVPEVHDHALQLSLNVFKDLLLSPAWSVEDLRRIVQLPAFDPARFVALVRRAQCVAAVGLVAAFLGDATANANASAEWKALSTALATPHTRTLYERLFRAAGKEDVRVVLRMLVAHSGSDTWSGTLRGLAFGSLGALRWKARRIRGALVEGAAPHPTQPPRRAER